MDAIEVALIEIAIAEHPLRERAIRNADVGHVAQLAAIDGNPLVHATILDLHSLVAATVLVDCETLRSTVLDLHAGIAVALVLEASGALIASTTLHLRLLRFSIPMTVVRLEVGETLHVAAMLDALGLRLVLATTTLDLHGPAAALGLHRHLTATAATALPSEGAIAAAAVLDLHLMLGPATSARLLASAAALLLILLASALLLGLLAATMSAAGLRRRRSGNRKSRDTCRQDELAHLKSPHHSGCKRSCFGAVPPAGSDERSSRTLLSLRCRRLAGEVQVRAGP